IDTDPQAAETVVEDLAEVFRASLNEVQNKVPLQEEIDLCRRYLNIEQLRLGARLEVIWDIPTTLAPNSTIPMLTIQPVLENAIHHGIQHLPEGGAMTIRIRFDGPWISIKIRNPIPNTAVQRSRGNHIALDNIRHRLTALYGANASLKQRIEASWFCVEIRYHMQTTIT
ncbi:MAG: histidine kinase, partial [Gammaproteobacteria bacterium]